MVEKNEIQLDEIDLLTIDMPAIKQGTTTPKEINESTIEIVKQEIINQINIFETLQYFNMVSVGCEKTA